MRHCAYTYTYIITYYKLHMTTVLTTSGRDIDSHSESLKFVLYRTWLSLRISIYVLGRLTYQKTALSVLMCSLKRRVVARISI